MSDGIDAQLRAIGRLIVNFNALEWTLRRCLWLLIRPDDERVGQTMTSGMDVSRVEERTKELVALTPLSDTLRNRCQEAVARAGEVRQTRNAFAHAFWRVPNDAVDLSDAHAAWARARKDTTLAQVPESRDADSIEKAASDAYNVGVVLEELFADLKRALSGGDAA